MSKQTFQPFSVSTGQDSYGQRSDFSGFPERCDEQADVGPNCPLKTSDLPAPMPMAEFDHCCGQHRWGTALEDQRTDYANYCENCPLLIERRRERVLRAGRAL
jgi:hypothetical protein